MKELLDEFWLVHIYDTRWLKAYKLSAAVQFAIRKTYFLYQMWDDMSQGVNNIGIDFRYILNFFYPMAKNFKMYHYSQIWPLRWPLEVKKWFLRKMNSCIRFRRSKTYKNDPLNKISKKSKIQNNLTIWQPK